MALLSKVRFSFTNLSRSSALFCILQLQRTGILHYVSLGALKDCIPHRIHLYANKVFQLCALHSTMRCTFKC